MAKIINFPGSNNNIWEGSMFCISCGSSWNATVEVTTYDYPDIPMRCPKCMKFRGLSRDFIEQLFLKNILKGVRNEKKDKPSNKCRKETL